MVTDALTTLTTSAGFPLIGGVAVGFGTGYFLKKIFKFIIFILGGIALLLGYLSYQKWILASWATVENQSFTMIEHAAHKVYVVTQQMGHSIPIGVGLMGFVPGVFLGFLKG